MAVMFTCPTCGQSARIVTGGYVEAHEVTPGVVCTFTKTASAGKPPSSGRASRQELPEEREARLEGRRAAKLANAERMQSQRERAAAKRAKAEAARQEQKRKTLASRVECPRCRALVMPSGKSPTGLVAHTRPSGRWCKGGAEPTGKQAKVKQSVWPVSGGLPGLGRR